MKKIVCVFLSLICLTFVSGGAAESIGLRESRYSSDFEGGSLVEITERNFYYESCTVDSYKNPYDAPTFIPSRSNACAVEAGGNVFVYYDRLFDDLIPDYSHKYVWGKFTYGTQNSAVDNMFWTLYDMMGTNTNGNSGTSVAGFKSGMQQYASSKGYTANITRATGNYLNINLDFLKSELKQEKLAVIFFDTFSITPFGGWEHNDGYDTINYSVYSGLHVMLVYGYEDVYYYDADKNLIDRQTYLYASTGYNGARLAWVNLNNYCTVDDIYVLEVV